MQKIAISFFLLAGLGLAPSASIAGINAACNDGLLAAAPDFSRLAQGFRRLFALFGSTGRVDEAPEFPRLDPSLVKAAELRPEIELRLGGPIVLEIENIPASVETMAGERMIVKTATGQKVATFSYFPQADEIVLGEIYVEVPYRRKGVGVYLFAEILERFPTIRRVSGILLDTNRRLLRGAQSAGLEDCISAFRQTVVYMRLKRFHFVDDLVVTCDGIDGFIATGPARAAR